MNDPLGLIGNASRLTGPTAPTAGRMNGPGVEPTEGPSFTEVFKGEIDKVNSLQTDAAEAAEDLMTGRRNDVETVMNATQKADLAFRTLMSVRNKVMSAYDEIKQVRV